MTTAARRHLQLALDALGSAAARRYGGATAESTFPTSFGDRRQDAAAQLAIGAANHVTRLTGTGAEMTLILTRLLHAELLELLDTGYDASAVRVGIDQALKAVDAALVAQSRPITAIGDLTALARRVADVDDHLAGILAGAAARAGPDGAVVLADAGLAEALFESAPGCRLDRGLQSAYFLLAAASRSVNLHRPLAVLIAATLETAADALHLVRMAGISGRPLLVVAEGYGDEALATLVVRNLSRQARIAAIQCPGFGNRRKAILQDLAVLTGGRVVSGNASRTVEADLGELDRVMADLDETVLVGCKAVAGPVARRIEELQAAIDVTTAEFDREQMARRVAMLAGVTVVHPRAASLADDLDVSKDYLSALRAARQHGIVAGHGRGLFDCNPVLVDMAAAADDDEARGIETIQRAILEPFRCAVEKPVSGEIDIPAGNADLTQAVSLSMSMAVGTAWRLLIDGVSAERIAGDPPAP